MSEPIPYYFDPINRNAIIVKPKKPFFDWVNAIDDTDKIEEVDENNIYLIREMDSNFDVQEWISDNYEALFVNELNDWYVDETLWPKHRTYELFCEWFKVTIHSMILDLEDFPITKH